MTRQAAAKSILSGFELSDTRRSVIPDRAAERRAKLLSGLEQQRAAAEATQEGKEYFGTREVWKTNEQGEKVKTTEQKRFKKWFYTNDGEIWYLEVRYGNKPLQLAQGKTAIVVGTKDKLVSVIEKVMEAVKAKELDEAIAATVKVRSEARRGRKVA